MKQLILPIITYIWMPIAMEAADDGTHNMELFLDLNEGTQMHIAKYVLGDIKRELFDKPMVKHILRSHEGCINSTAFNHAGNQIVSASDETVRIWDVRAGQELHILRGHENWVNSAAFNHDGHHIVSASDDSTVRIWDVRTGQELHILRGHENWVNSAAFNNAGNQIVSASDDRTVRIWDALTGKELHILRGHENWVRSAAFNHAGNQIVSASDDRTVRVWDIHSGREIYILRGHKDWVLSAAFNNAGNQVISVSDDNTIRIWESLPYERYHFDLEQALWIYNTYHEIIQGKAAHKEKNPIIGKSAIEQSIQEQYPEILNRLQMLRSEKN